MKESRAIAYYISAHGYGHGVRSSDIIRAFHRNHPEIRVVIVSDLPLPFFRNRLATQQVLYRQKSFDVGMVQVDSIRVNVSATLEKLKSLYARRQDLIAEEREFMKTENIAAVVVDIPALPLEAAALQGIPRVAIGNFGWNWIYSAYVDRDPQWKKIIQYLEEGYSKANRLLRLPFSEETRVFPHVEDIPLVASPGRDRRKEIAALTGCRADKKWILLSFTTLNWNGVALDKLERLADYEFFTVQPLAWRRKNIRPIDREIIPFSDVVASVDGVVSKPGFGIISDCIVNRKPLLYAERQDFLEYPILVQAISRYLKHYWLPAESLYEGHIEQALEAVWRQPDPPFSMPQGGADIAAQRIASSIAKYGDRLPFYQFP